MKRLALNLFFGAAMTVAALQAQNRMSEDAKAAYQPIKLNILKAAEKMPDSEYGFKPTTEVRTFGEWIAHAAEAQTAICGVAKGAPFKRDDSISKIVKKADLIAALKASNEFCDAVYTAMTDQDGAEIVKTPFGPKPKLGVLTFNIQHDAETYGSIAIYLRLKGIVPPSSEGK
jgi:DinB superfamily